MVKINKIQLLWWCIISPLQADASCPGMEGPGGKGIPYNVSIRQIHSPDENRRFEFQAFDESKPALFSCGSLRGHVHHDWSLGKSSVLIVDLFVSESARKEKIATRLLEALLQYCKREHIGIVRCNIEKEFFDQYISLEKFMQKGFEILNRGSLYSLTFVVPR